jgi:hypothetical protein
MFSYAATPGERAPECGAADASTAWSQVWDVKIIPWRTEYLLPRRRCGYGTTTVACPPDGGIVNGINFGPVLNTAAVALTVFGNVPTERASQLIDILYGQNVSAGFVDRANSRLAQQLIEVGSTGRCSPRSWLSRSWPPDESPVQVGHRRRRPRTPGSP